VELKANPPSEEQIDAYLQEMARLWHGNEEAINFWAIQAHIDLDTD
jgi:hypothetical protein